jgi:predicted XRE-type DNA-binding protein
MMPENPPGPRVVPLVSREAGLAALLAQKVRLAGRRALVTRKLTQASAATLLGVNQPKVSALEHGLLSRA